MTLPTMTDELRRRVEQRLEAALETSGARDPRDHYRELLRDLKEKDPDAYGSAVGYYEETLLPAVAAGDEEPLKGWREFGRRIAELSAPGRTVALDASGRARAYDPEGAAGDLVLHLPEESRRRALLVALPQEPSDAQRAAYRLLVAGRQTLEGR